MKGTYWQLFDDGHPFGCGEARQTVANMGFECRRELGVLPSPPPGGLWMQNHIGHRALAPRRVLASYNRHLKDVGMTRQF